MNQRKTDIILAGVGGQGILSIAAVIGTAAVIEGLSLKQAEVHGMSQRGGAVQSHLRISPHEIASDLIPLNEADLILSIEPMEALRYLPFLSEHGCVVTNKSPFINIPAYPDTDQIYSEIQKIPSHVLIDADEIARNVGSARSSNMVILGSASGFIHIKKENLHKAIRQVFGKKGEEVINLNINAFEAGRAFSGQK